MEEFEPAEHGNQVGTSFASVIETCREEMFPRQQLSKDIVMNQSEAAAKDVAIIVNGREKTVEKGDLAFQELVNLAFDDPPIGEFICFTITYRRGQGNKPEGTLIENEEVKVKEGMIFNVTATDKS